MGSTKKLEQKWYWYKGKNVLQVMLMVGSVYLIGVGTYYAYIEFPAIKKFVLNESSSQSKQQVEKVAVLEVKEEHTDDSQKVVLEPIVLSDDLNFEISDLLEDKKEERYEVSLEPVIPMIDMDREEKVKKHVKKRYVKKYKKPSNQHLVRAKASTYLTARELSVIGNSLDSRKTKKMKFKSSSANYISIMKRKFKKSKNPREALLLAKAFYGQKNYSESEQWALIANKLNTNLEESWFLFAKSKAKLGQKKEAVKILVTYYKKTNSTKAKVLIAKINSGRL